MYIFMIILIIFWSLFRFLIISFIFKSIRKGRLNRIFIFFSNYIPRISTTVIFSFCMSIWKWIDDELVYAALPQFSVSFYQYRADLLICCCTRPVYFNTLISLPRVRVTAIEVFLDSSSLVLFLNLFEKEDWIGFLSSSLITFRELVPLSFLQLV